MEISKEEYMKIFDYVLENMSELENDEYFSNQFLLEIRKFVKGKRTNDDFMTIHHKHLLKEYFKKHAYSFDEDTPQLFTSDEECINRVLANSIISINYIDAIEDKSTSFKQKILQLALNNNYILSKESPNFFKRDIHIALQSIKLDCNSANYIDYNDMFIEDCKIIIQELLQTNYQLTKESPLFLAKNKDINLHSIRINIDSFNYSALSVHSDYEIFKLLIQNQYHIPLKTLQDTPLTFLQESSIFKCCLDQLDVYYYDDAVYQNCFSKLYFEALTHYPTIKSFDGVINYLGEKTWEDYRKDNLSDLSNIYGKICSLIKNSPNFDAFYQSFKELGEKMAFILDDKYPVLLEVLKKYYHLYHNNQKDLDEYRLIISRLSALYIAGSKEFHKNNIRDLFYSNIRPYFKVHLDNPIVKKRTVQSFQKDIFISKYNNNDPQTIAFINNLKKKYFSLYGDWMEKAIRCFLEKNITDLFYVMKRPYKYKDYKRYQETLKLVHRLNSGYINYQDAELRNYQDIIVYDINTKQYICNMNLEKINISKCQEYEQKEIIFRNFIKEVMIYVRKIKVDEKLYQVYVQNMTDEFEDLPFNDKFYEFNDKYLEKITLSQVINHCMSESTGIGLTAMMSKSDYKDISAIISNNSLLWLWLIENHSVINKLTCKYSIKINQLIEIINNIRNIKRLSKYMTTDIKDFNNLMFLNEIAQFSNESISLLGFDIIKTLCTNTSYIVNHTKEEIIHHACDFVLQMAKKNISTVPYIEGQVNGYYYSMYDSLDTSVLTSGPYTDSCLKVLGNEYDFFQYCMFDKNGFVIKLTNSNGTFIGRAAGIRNGNVLYINQLRTIFDIGGEGYKGKYETERADLIEVLKKACQDIVDISQNNSSEKIKIDYVFITQSYIFSKYPADLNISSTAYDLIGDQPINLETSDWKKFIETTYYLKNATYDKCVRTDYDEYRLICLASSKGLKNLLDNEDIIRDDVPALYQRKRNHLLVAMGNKLEIQNRINQIRALYCYYHKEEFSNVILNDDSIIVIGDNWYLIFDNGIINCCIQDFDEIAKKEFMMVSQVIMSYQDNPYPKIKQLFN